MSLSADGNTVAIGPKNDDNGNYSGHVRVFVLEDDVRRATLDKW